MKKIFTLIASVAMALGANAATDYVVVKDDPTVGANKTITSVDGITMTFNADNWVVGGGGSKDAKTVDGVALQGKYANTDVNGSTVTFTTTAAGTLTIFNGGAIATNKTLVMTVGETGLAGTVLSTGAVIESGASPAAEIPAYDGIKYTLEAGKTYTFAVTGTKWRLAGFKYVSGEGGGTVDPGTTTETNPQIISWSEAKAKGSAASTYGDGTFKFIGTDTDASKHEIDANTAYFGDAEGQLKFDFRYKTGGKSGSKNAISLTIPAKGKVLVYARTGSNSATDRNVVLTQNGATLIDHILLESEAQTVVIESAKSDENPTGEKAVYPVLEANVVAGTVDVTYPVNSVNFYGFQFVPEGATPITGISTVTTSTKANANAPIYNLAGQQVNKNYKGVVIQNGVKRVQK